MADPTLDPAAFEESIDKALAVLALSKEHGAPWMTAAEVSRALRDKHGVGLDWRTVDAKLKASCPDLAARRKRAGRREFSILRKGEDRINRAGPSFTLIDPSRALQAVSTLHSMLGALSGDLRICDPYLDHVTIEHLQATPVKSRISFLTQTVREQNRVVRLLAAARIEKRVIEIRIVPTASIHDRYLIDDASMILLGGSLNGFGKKQCFVVAVGDDIRSLTLPDFDARWAVSTPWP